VDACPEFIEGSVKKIKEAATTVLKKKQRK